MPPIDKARRCEARCCPTVVRALGRLLLVGGLLSGLAPAAAAQDTAWTEQEVVAVTNFVRQGSRLAPLHVNPRLALAARFQARLMAWFGEMAHTLPGSPLPTLASRIQCVGYNYSWVAENLAADATNSISVVIMWMDSPEHRANLLSPYATDIGVGVAYGSDGQPYYCMVLGRPY